MSDILFKDNLNGVNRKLVDNGDGSYSEAVAASIPAPSDATANGNITTQNLVPTGAATAGSAVEISTVGRSTLGIQVNGTYTGALSLQLCLLDGSWVTVGGTSLVAEATGAGSATIASATTGVWQADVSGALKARITGLAAMTGTAQVYLRATTADGIISLGAPLPAGGNTIGAVNLGTGGTGATSLGKAEDAAAASGDTGIAMLGVRVPATPAAQTSAAADYGAVALNAEGKVVVAVGAADELGWQANPVTLTTTTSTALKAAAAAGVRNYLTDITIANTSATGVRVDLLDGATVIRSWWAAPTSNTVQTFDMAIKSTAATALNVQLSAAVTDVRVSGNGYLGV